jgi:outer membrane murein-binding lipoprotein Lpp
MKQMLVVGTMILATTMMLGCRSESERMASMAERMVSSQNEVNSSVVRTNETFVDLNKELQQERKGLQNERLALNEQFETLEQDRRDLHRQRRSELAWSEGFQFLAIVIAAISPLFLCAYLIWAASQRSVDQEEVNTILLQELASSNPRLIAAPNLPAIENQQSEESRSETITKQEK